jgi:RIO kinase 2
MYFEQPYESVMILTSGIDLIALKRLADKGIVVGIGRQIGVGKEADVYEAINDIGEKVSIKVFRLGRISFRGIARKRSYSVIKSSHKWLLRNYISAKKEYENLVVVYQRGISAPRPIYRTMHVLVMEYLDGFLLKDLQEVDDPYSLYANIINEIKKTWNLGYVNGDLSEYNIFILNESGRPVIIDWPQAIKRENPVSIELIKRDVSNITKFFIKRFDCEYNKLKKIIYSISLSFLE